MINGGTVWSSVTCSQTQNTDRLESNRWLYFIDVNEQWKQVSNARYRVVNLNEDDTDGDVLCYQVLRDRGMTEGVSRRWYRESDAGR